MPRTWITTLNTTMEVAPNKKVADLLMPLYTRLSSESIRVSEVLRLVRRSGSRASTRDAVHSLHSPAEWFSVTLPSRLVTRTAARKRIRRELRGQLNLLQTRLQGLHARINTVSESGTDAVDASVLAALETYSVALHASIRILGPMNFGRGRATAPFQALQLVSEVSLRAGQILAIPMEVVQQFKEESYLEHNADVELAVAAGAYASGLEHFCTQGIKEADESGRSGHGIDLALLRRLHLNDPAMHAELDEMVSVIEQSGVFDVERYAASRGAQTNPIADYCLRGHLENHDPCAAFHSAWYRESYPEVGALGIPPLYHYLTVGESNGHKPAEWFDPRWYARQHGLAGDRAPAFEHYVSVGRARKLSPNAVFDVRHYLRSYPDVASNGIDPVEHFFAVGWSEGREPSPAFDMRSYRLNTPGLHESENPVLHFLRECERKDVDSQTLLRSLGENTSHQALSATDVTKEIRHFANAGEYFEQSGAASELPEQARTIAFYLPQFHAFEQNDQWWGKGFSEWRNVARGTPRFAGHYQPRIPRDLGFYDLNDTAVLHEQARLARDAGINAFCFYYYWFDGKRLMDAPLDAFVEEEVDQDFCIMWANENWTRTWDGAESEVLIEQTYQEQDEAAFIADTARYMAHPRYIRVQGRPLFILYRPGLLPEGRKTLARWRALWTEALGVEPWIFMVQGFGDEDPGVYALDGAVEFPPHKLCVGLPDINDQLDILDPGYSGNVRSYADVVARSLGESAPSFPLLKTVVPSWDNDARREGRGMTLHGSTPKLYERWLRGVIDYAQQNPFGDESLVFVNAWNEWAEGAYLEPDVHWGHAYLNATRRAVYGLSQGSPEQGRRERVLLVGHDAHRHGAQMLLLNLAQTMSSQFGVEVTVALKSSGPLVDAYREHARTVVLAESGESPESQLSALVEREGITIAICNTSVTGDLVPALSDAGVQVVSLIHELPRLISEYGLEGHVASIARSASRVVFPSEIVRDGFLGIAREQGVLQPRAEVTLRPQGTYAPVSFDEQARKRCRRELGIGPKDKVVLNAGYADLRKGFDLFLQTARQMTQEREDVHFVWAGALCDDMQRWVGSDLEESSLDECIHLIGFTDDMASWYSAADALFLSSREDPYPTVVLEAMDVGLPVVLFKGATGFDQLMSQHGHVVARSNAEAIRVALTKALDQDTEHAQRERRAHVDQYCRFDDYAFSLLEMLRPELKRVSVVVPNFEYERYLPSRLASVFEQTYPVFETLVLDDASSDDSVSVINECIKQSGRTAKLVANESNSGNVFAQWKKGLELARGEHLWIAEADDLADSCFIQETVLASGDDTALCFTDSRQIGTDDELLATSYDYYYREVDKSLFGQDFKLAGSEFIARALAERNVILNVSSVLWRRAALESAMGSVGDDLASYKLVGDWCLYLEALSADKAQVSYVSASLNVHRRHPTSVTHALDAQRHLDEVLKMHERVRSLISADKPLQQRLEAYADTLRTQFGLDDAPEQRAA